MKTKLFSKQNLSSLFFYISILVFIIGFNFSDTPTPTGWYQQFMPNLNGASISDITFVDSLNGFAVTGYRTGNDTAYILKTTNSGDNWVINNTFNYPFYRIQFINNDTGYALSFQNLFKTINKGVNWQIIWIPLSTAFVDMHVLTIDSIWAVASNGLTGGVFRTTNGGVNWTLQLNLGSSNPNHVYFFDRNIGYISKDNTYIRKTTDGGQTWNIISNTEGFSKIYFIDNNTGWKFYIQMEKTTNGGQTWVLQPRPTGGGIYILGIPDFSVLGSDTIWSPSGYILYPNNQTRGILFRSTNGGNYWQIQLPDTSINISYHYIEFSNSLHGWVYGYGKGIHTITGGDTTWITGIKQISNNIPMEIKLEQNYPNPFNPITKIKFSVNSNVKVQTSDVKIKVYDILGREVSTLLDKKLSSGEYEITFDAKDLTSGVYFYSLIADNNLIDTKKMILVK